jgi:hypothetical protein
MDLSLNEILDIEFLIIVTFALPKADFDLSLFFLPFQNETLPASFTANGYLDSISAS